MHRDPTEVSVPGTVLLMLALVNGVVLVAGLTDHPGWYRLLYLSVPAFLGAALSVFRNRHR